MIKMTEKGLLFEYPSDLEDFIAKREEIIEDHKNDNILQEKIKMKSLTDSIKDLNEFFNIRK